MATLMGRRGSQQGSQDHTTSVEQFKCQADFLRTVAAPGCFHGVGARSKAQHLRHIDLPRSNVYVSVEKSVTRRHWAVAHLPLVNRLLLSQQLFLIRT